MKRHTEIGYRIAKSSQEFERIANLIRHHHEYWDGTGYPKALKGAEIPLESRILAIADAYDAMTHNRVYHEAVPITGLRMKSSGAQKRNSTLPIVFVFIILAQTTDTIKDSLG